MTHILIPAAATLVGVIVTGLVAWLIARRTKSGKINTSEATVLWSAAEKLREEQREEMIALRAEAVNTRVEAVALRTETVTMRSEVITLRAELVPLRAELVKAHKATATCRTEVSKLLKRLDAVEKQMDNA